jgi:glycosyltransferase involved in cell wall biosynthesis
MPVRHLCIAMPEFAGGGAQRVGVNLANHYAREGRPVSILVFRDEGPLRTELDPAVRVHDLGTRSSSPYRAIARALRELRPDTVLGMYRNVGVPLGLSRPWFGNYRLVVREANTLDNILGKPPLRRLKNLFKLRLAYGQAAAVIANSTDAADELVAHKVAARERIVFLPNPVDVERIQSLAARPCPQPWLAPGHAEFTLLTSGRLHVQKNQAMLLSALALALPSCPRLRLVVLGEGELLAALQAQARAAGIEDKVHFAGYVADPHPWVAGADAFVLPSSWEGFPNVMLEAMACRTPVIATDCPGAGAQILEQGRCGTLVPMDDPMALAQAILGLVQSPDPERVERAHARALEFSQDAVARRYAQVLGLD